MYVKSVTLNVLNVLELPITVSPVQLVDSSTMVPVGITALELLSIMPVLIHAQLDITDFPIENVDNAVVNVNHVTTMKLVSPAITTFYLEMEHALKIVELDSILSEDTVLLVIAHVAHVEMYQLSVLSVQVDLLEMDQDVFLAVQKEPTSIQFQ